MAARFLPYVQIEAGDEVVALEHGDERARHDDAARRVLPAHEGFEAHDALGARVALRLPVQHELMVRQRALHLEQDLRLGLHLLGHLGFVPGDALGVGAFDGVHGDHRMVAGGDYGHVRAVDGAHSESGLEPDGVLGIERLLLQLAFHAFFVDQAVRQQQREIVAAQVAGYAAVLTGDLPDTRGDGAQDGVACFAPMPLVVYFEVLDVDVRCVVRDVGHVGYQAFGLVVKRSRIVQAGQLVAFAQ